MRKVRGVKKLRDYLSSINCDISESTIQRMMSSDQIPFNRVAKRVIIFDLDEIDRWLSGSHEFNVYEDSSEKIVSIK